MARDAKLVIKINDEIKDKLQAYAGRLGLTMSALSAFIIGNWIDQQERVVSPIINQLGDAMKDVIIDEMNKRE